MSKRNKTPVLIVGIHGNPMFTVLPFNTISQRNRAYNELKRRGTITLPNKDKSLQVLQIRHVSCAVVTAMHEFANVIMENNETSSNKKSDDNVHAIREDRDTRPESRSVVKCSVPDGTNGANLRGRAGVHDNNEPQRQPTEKA